MDMQNVSNLQIPEGIVRTIHDKDNRLLWGRVAYNTKYSGDTIQNGTPTTDIPVPVQVVMGEQTVEISNGKNLLPLTNQDFTLKGVHYYVENGTLYLDGTSTGETYPDNKLFRNKFAFTLPAGTYTMKTFGGGFNSVRVKKYSDNSNITADMTASVPARTFTLTERTKIYFGFYIYNKTFSQLDTKLVIASGSSVDEYQPFNGSIHQISLSSNLVSAYDFAMGGMTNGNKTSSNYRITNADNPIAVEPNTVYTISVELGSSVQGFRVGVHQLNKDMGFINDLGWQQLASDKYTFTTGENTYYIGIVGSLSTTSNNVTTGGTENTDAYTSSLEWLRGCTLWVENGSDAVHNPPIELCKIGDYQDYIYKSGGDWYVHKATGKAVFDGDQTENWKQSGAYNAVHNIQLADILPANNNNLPYQSKICCDNFTLCDFGYNAGYLYPSQNGKTAVTSDKYLSFNYSQTTSIAAWTTWLSSNNVTAYYPLATPTDNQITDAMLVGQLEAIHEWLTRYGYNAIVTGNLPLIVDRTNL